ncbi:pyridoxamine 5'-phosphate oxidase family protein [Microbacter margulisiae]|uniref:Pyridoxamine 5'-phosphate oxidase family protein n=1 Tax=Microbacter margulisiae TaxID=1350067 RepID=A0A7W5H1N9_9PORP|nr:pyridoxamine 5'-phosphate oxidase family protein [Microbacter margulisiae]MBB3186814.1 hypothetical protein [Microbacter margulisiae]
MRRKEKEITNQQVIEEILSKGEVCRIAMMDGNRPYLVPLNYGYDGHAFYIHSAQSGKKIELLKQNPEVCFEIEYGAMIVRHEESCKWSEKYRSVIGYATVEMITSFEEKKRGLDIIMAHNGRAGNNVYKEKQVEAIVILKLHIRQITGKQSGDWE